ncbi:MAG: putative transcriptional regulator YheO, partial [Oleiphilaceae bacterium]
MKIEMDLCVLAKFIAGVIGSHCEIVIHDLTDVSKSVVAIENGHVTGRNIGSPATDLALKKIKSIQDGNDEPFVLNYRGRTVNGSELRSSTLIISKGNQPKYMICLNIDDSHIKSVIDMIKVSVPNYAVEDERDENFYNSIEDVSHNIIEQTMHDLGMTDLLRLTLAEKNIFVKTIDKSGLFTIKGNVQKVSKMMGISE